MAVTTTTIDGLPNRTVAVNKATDKVPLWQPGAATGSKTVDATLADVFAETDAAVTAAADAASTASDEAAAAQSTADDAISDAAAAQLAADNAQTTANAAIPASEKGVANGVATLDGTGKIPASQLNVTGSSFKGNWNATTNTPTLSDGTGTGGDWYFVQSGASQNLGSGAVTWTTGALIIHDGAKWVENEAVNTVISVAGRTGAITLTTADVAPSTGRNYATDNEDAAMNASDAPAAGNPFMTESAVDDAITAAGLGSVTYNVTVTGGNSLRAVDFGDGIRTVGIGQIRTLASLGYSNSTAATQWPLTAAAWGSINASTVDYDTVALQEAFETLRNGGNKIRKLELGPGYFTITGHEVYIPSYKSGGVNGGTYDPQQFIFDGVGGMIRVADASLSYGLTSQITTQVEAVDEAVDNRWTICNLSMRGVSAGTAIRLGASRGAKISQIEINGFTTGFQAGFLLNSLYENVVTVNCTTGVKVDKGWWPSAGYSNAGNQPRFNNCKFRTVATNHVGCHIIGTDTPVIRDCTIEGTNAAYGIFIDNADSTVCKYAIVDNIHVEMEDVGDFVGAAIYFGGQSAFGIRVSGIYNQFGGTPNCTLLHLHSKVGVNKAWMSFSDNSENSDAWTLKNTTESGGNGSWSFDNFRLKGNPSSAATVADVTNAAGIWATATATAPAPAAATGLVIPTAGRIRINPLLL
jgi:hypothetical protein